MQLPILSSLTTLFSKVTEDFKALFQSWSLVAAGIYLFLNLVLLYPVLKSAPAVRAYGRLDTLIQALAGTFILFGLGYLINSLGGFFVSLANGRLLRGSLVGGIMGWRERRRYERLVKRLKDYANGKADVDAVDVNRAAYRLAYDFPDEDSLTLTRLGNIQAAVADYSVNQYGAHLDTVWPIVESTLGKEDEPLLKKIGDEQVALTFLCTVAVLLGFTAATAVPIRVWLAQQAWPLNILIFVALLAVAYITYHAAALRAAAWGRLVRLGLDLHLDKAEESLGLRALKGEDQFETRKTRWKDVTEWLAYGGLVVSGNPVIIPKPSAAWYEKPDDKPDVKLTCSAQLRAEVHAAEQAVESPSLTTAELLVPGPVIEYVIPITHLAAADEPEPLQFRAPVGGFIRLSDSRIPVIQSPVIGTLHRPNAPTGWRVTAIINTVKGGPDALLWPVQQLDYRDSATLIYRLEGGWRLDISDAGLVSVAPARSGRGGLVVRLRVKGEGPKQIKLIAWHLAEERVKGNAVWRFRTVDNIETVRTVYEPAVNQRRAVWTLDYKPIQPHPVEFVFLLPIKDHGLTQAMEVSEKRPTTRTLLLTEVGDVPGIQTGTTTTVTCPDGKPIEVALPPRGRLQALKGAEVFKEADADAKSPDKAEASLDRYDLLTEDVCRNLSAADLNNLACFMAWQQAPDVQQTFCLLQRACEKSGDNLDPIIRANLNALSPPGRMRAGNPATESSSRGGGVHIDLLSGLFDRLMRTLKGGNGS